MVQDGFLVRDKTMDNVQKHNTCTTFNLLWGINIITCIIILDYDFSWIFYEKLVCIFVDATGSIRG
jgi:hypothetical protein